METRFQKIIEMNFKNLKSDLYTLKSIWKIKKIVRNRIQTIKIKINVHKDENLNIIFIDNHEIHINYKFL